MDIFAKLFCFRLCPGNDAMAAGVLLLLPRGQQWQKWQIEAAAFQWLTLNGRFRDILAKLPKKYI